MASTGKRALRSCTCWQASSWQASSELVSLQHALQVYSIFQEKTSKGKIHTAGWAKSEPINPKVQQTKPQPKPQPKLQKSVAIKEKDINPEVKKPTTTQNQTGNNNTSKVNKNLMPPSNAQKRSSSMSFVGSESEYGIITSDSKKCKSKG